MSKPVQNKSTFTLVAGISMMTLSALFVLLVALGGYMGMVGASIKGFFLGAFGLSFYAFMTAVFTVGVFVVRGVKPVLSAGKICCVVGIYILAVMILHLVTSRNLIAASANFGDYLSKCYASDGTFGGALYGVFVYPVHSVIGEAFSYVFYVFLGIVLSFSWTDFALFKGIKHKKKTASVVRTEEITAPVLPKRREDNFARAGDPSIGGSNGVVHSLFVDEVHATVKAEQPKQAPIPKYAESGAPMQSVRATETSPRLNVQPTKLSKQEPVPNAPLSFSGKQNEAMQKSTAMPMTNLPDYIREKYSAPTQSADGVRAHSSIVMPYVAAPERVVHSSERHDASDSRPPVLNGERRSEELVRLRRNEEKIAEAEKHLQETTLSPSQPEPSKPLGGIINGDDVSAQILAKRKAREEAAAKDIAQRDMSRFSSSAPHEAAYMRPSIFNEPIKKENNEPTEIVLPPIEKTTFEDRTRGELNKQQPAVDERSDFLHFSTEEINRQPTSGLDFGRAFKGAHHDEAGDLPKAPHDYFVSDQDDEKSDLHRLSDENSPADSPHDPLDEKRPAPRDFNLDALFSKQPSAPTDGRTAEDGAAASRTLDEGTDSSERQNGEPIGDAFAFGQPSDCDESRDHRFDADGLNRSSQDETKKNNLSDKSATDLSGFFQKLVTDNPESKEPLTPQMPIQVAPIDGEDRYDYKKDIADANRVNAEACERKEREAAERGFREYAASGTRDSARQQLGLDDYRSQMVKEESSCGLDEGDLFRTSGKAYVFPPVDLLKNSSTYSSEVTDDCLNKSEILVETLKDFKIPCEVTGICRGPAVSRYELQIADGVPVNKVRQRAEDISYNLAAKSGVRIETPIPGKRAVGVEVPNEEIGVVSLREIMESNDFQHAKSPLAFAVGTDIGGKRIVCDLIKMPHLLIAGATGSGKSSCLNSLIVSMISRVSPDDVRMILIDPKMVEFTAYNGVPHMLLDKAITEWQNALNALDWLIQEYERRYRIFYSKSVRSLAEYRKIPDVVSGKLEKLPYLVLIVDELADLISNNKSEFEDKIRSIAQKARAAGIHMVIATQRPSADIITGTIKANLSSRIAFAVSSNIDSRVILDQAGAENLLGRGDMLYYPFDFPNPIRVQGAFVTDEECHDVVEFIKKNNTAVFNEAIYDAIYPKRQETETADDGEDGDNSDSGVGSDSLMLQVLWYFIDINKASACRAQRKFHVGFNRAANIVDELEYAQYIGPIGSGGSSKERLVLITKEEFIDKFGEPKW